MARSKEPSLTFGQLSERLAGLGFETHQVALDGNQLRVFKHPGISGSMIVLPDQAHGDVVEPLYVESVLVTLKRLDLLPETNPLLN